MYSIEEAISYEKFIKHHIEDVNEQKFLNLLKKTGVHKCVDPACNHIHGAAKPGSILGEGVNKSLTQTFDEMKALGIDDFTAVIHLYCGLLAVVKGLYTVADQHAYINDMSPRIVEVASQSGVDITIAPLVPSGSAVEYMNYMRLNS